MAGMDETPLPRRRRNRSPDAVGLAIARSPDERRRRVTDFDTPLRQRTPGSKARLEASKGKLEVEASDSKKQAPTPTSNVAAGAKAPVAENTSQLPLTIVQPWSEAGDLEFSFEGRVYRVKDERAFLAVLGAARAAGAPESLRSVSSLRIAQRAAEAAAPKREAAASPKREATAAAAPEPTVPERVDPVVAAVAVARAEAVAAAQRRATVAAQESAAAGESAAVQESAATPQGVVLRKKAQSLSELRAQQQMRRKAMETGGISTRAGPATLVSKAVSSPEADGQSSDMLEAQQLVKSMRSEGGLRKAEPSGDVSQSETDLLQRATVRDISGLDGLVEFTLGAETYHSARDTFDFLVNKASKVQSDLDDATFSNSDTC